MIDAERLHEIEQKLRCCGYLSHYSDVLRDVTWLPDQLAERDARIAELEAHGYSYEARSAPLVRRGPSPGSRRPTRKPNRFNMP